MYQVWKIRSCIAIFVFFLTVVGFYIHNKISDGNKIDSVIIRPSVFPQIQMDKIALSEAAKAFHLPIKLKNKFTGAKLVHLDLKGAPLKISFYIEFFSYLFKIGATGVLIEYEDMFPYWGDLQDLTAYNKYSKRDITVILKLAKKNHLDVIPLVQTFGHMEFVLKQNQYRYLREVDSFPQVLCPTNPNSSHLIEQMIDQIVALHPKSRYIHIGSDEVYYIGQCSRCVQFLSDKKWSHEQLFLYHVKKTVDYLKMKYPKIRPIMWDDEFRNLEESLIRDFNIDVDIMIWKYTPEIASAITNEILEKYVRVFKGFWIASSFKGSTAPNSLVTDLTHHLSNHIAWMNLVDEWKQSMFFKGIALTGWQRYDHFSVLCELLPVAIPSLTICLKFLNGEVIDEDTMTKTLGCDFSIPWTTNEINYVRSTDCPFPGSDLYNLVNTFYILLQKMEQRDKHVAKGWLSWYNIINKYSNPAHADQATSSATYDFHQLEYLKESLKIALSKVYDNYTVDEWITTNVSPISLKLKSILMARDKVMGQSVWPRRPLEINAKKQKSLDELCHSFSILCVLIGT